MRKYGKYIFAVLVLFAFIIRLVMAQNNVGYGATDLSCYERWAKYAASDLGHIYRNTDVDYPPVYLYILFLVGKLLLVFEHFPIIKILLLKLPAIFADMLSGIFIYRIAGRNFNKLVALIISVLYLFNPAIFINSAMWGQTDSILTLIAILALYYLSKDKIIPSTVLFVMACLMKPQGFFFLPVLLLEVIKKKDIKKFFLCVGTGLATGFLIILPFTIGQDVFWIFRMFIADLAKYSYATVHAFNLFFLLKGDLIPDSTLFLFLSYKTWGLIFSIGVLGFISFLYLKSKSPLRIYLMTLLLQSCVFMFTGRMHERYLYPAIMLIIIVFIHCKDRRLIPLFSWMSIFVFVNQFVVLYCSNYLDDVRLWLPYFTVTGYVFSLLGLWLVIYLIRISRSILNAAPDCSLSQKKS